MAYRMLCQGKNSLQSSESEKKMSLTEYYECDKLNERQVTGPFFLLPFFKTGESRKAARLSLEVKNRAYKDNFSVHRMQAA